MGSSDIFAVIGPGTTREKFTAAATVLGLEKHSTLEGDGDKVAEEEIWVTPDKQNAIRWVEDPLLGLTFLRFQGPLRQRLVRDLKVKMHPPEEVIEMAQRAKKHDSQVDAIARLAITFPDYDEEAFALFVRYLQMQHPLLRRATLNAMGYRCWAEFIPLMEHVAQSDPAEEVRKTAERLLASCRAVQEAKKVT
jgi:hypothetical protein